MTTECGCCPTGSARIFCDKGREAGPRWWVWPTSMLEINGIAKRFGRVSAVENVSFQVHPGENVAFLGPNGAGKTTTLKMAVGLLKPDGGKVLVDGIDLVKEPVMAKSLLAYIPDVPYLFPRLTGWEHVTYVARAYKVSLAACRQKGSDLIEAFGLQPFINRPVEEYSHGTRQKVAWVAALVHEPRYLILDEPTVGLDPQNTRLVKDVLSYLAQNGTGILMSTHLMEMAEQLSSIAIMISGGRIVASGTLEAFRSQASEAAATLEDIFLRNTGGVKPVEALKNALGR